MKFLKGILYTLLGLFALLCLFVVLCACNPNLTDTLSDLLYGKSNNEETLEDTAPYEENSTSGGNGIEDVAAGNTNNMTGVSGIENTLPEEEQYVEPEELITKIPDEVAGKNGYVPVQAEEQEVEEKEAKDLEDTLGWGETGDDLQFDATMYPYYAMLDDKGKHLYRQIYANANALNKAFTPVEEVNANQLKTAFTALFCDQPQLFWMDTAYACKYKPDGKCVEIDLQFNKTSHNLESSKEEFENAANEIMNGAASLGSDYDKEVYVHNALLDKNTYNLRAPLNQSAYSALVNGQTVCAGYARAMQYIMEKLGVPCYYCMGYAGESHAWNIISLDDGYYNVDATWDDTDPNTFDYFNKSDSEFNKNHRRTDLSVYLPACNGTKYSNLEQNPEAVPQNEDTMMPQSEDNSQPQSENTTTQNEAEGQKRKDAPYEVIQNAGDVRSLEDAGFSEQDVITTMEDYNKNCTDQIQQNGLGDYEFQNVISESLYNQVFISYKNNGYRSAYADQMMEQLGAKAFNMRVQTEKLKNGEIILTHHLTIQ